jgi:hypothetical protein
LKTLQKFEDFQAEYEGSIPFTRSNVFNRLAQARFSLVASLVATILPEVFVRQK